MGSLRSKLLKRRELHISLSSSCTAIEVSKMKSQVLFATILFVIVGNIQARPNGNAVDRDVSKILEMVGLKVADCTQAILDIIKGVIAKKTGIDASLIQLSCPAKERKMPVPQMLVAGTMNNQESGISTRGLKVEFTVDCTKKTKAQWLAICSAVVPGATVKCKV